MKLASFFSEYLCVGRAAINFVRRSNGVTTLHRNLDCDIRYLNCFRYLDCYVKFGKRLANSILGV